MRLAFFHLVASMFLLAAGNNPKIRVCADKLILDPGRYRITAYLRGLDIGTGVWNQTTEFMFAGMYKAAKQLDVKFRLSWHFNVVAGDPYYALDCREDDYAWCNSSPDGDLIPAVHFERLREGLDDYRRMLTLGRLADEQPDTAAARAAKNLLAEILGAFLLGQRELTGQKSYVELRRKLDAVIESLR